MYWLQHATRTAYSARALEPGNVTAADATLAMRTRQPLKHAKVSILISVISYAVKQNLKLVELQFRIAV